MRGGTLFSGIGAPEQAMAGWTGDGAPRSIRLPAPYWPPGILTRGTWVTSRKWIGMRSLTPNQLTLWSSEAPASRFHWPENDVEWMTLVATWPSSPLALSKKFGLGGSSLKTSPVCCRQRADGILVPSSGRWRNAGMGGPTGHSMPSNSVSLNVVEGCSSSVTVPLTAILETGDLPQRYFLTPRVCMDILKRADERNRKLPDMLRSALCEAAEQAIATIGR